MKLFFFDIPSKEVIIQKVSSIVEPVDTHFYSHIEDFHNFDNMYQHYNYDCAGNPNHYIPQNYPEFDNIN